MIDQLIPGHPATRTAGPVAARRLADAAALVTIAIGLGLIVGVGTLDLQSHLHGATSALANSASPWLAGAFASGAVARRWWSALPAGLLACLAELAGYYAAAHLRGIPAGPDAVIMWTYCALVGGPVFGVAGWLWRDGRRLRGPSRLARGAGGAAMGVAFIDEGLIQYGNQLHYLATEKLYVAIGLALAVTLGLARRELGRTLVWVAALLPAGALAELILNRLL